MPEYIELEKALQRFEEIKKSEISLNDAFYLDGVMIVLETIPIADVAPVVHGKWILDAKNHCHCSRCLCGRNIETQIGWNYCPNCGSKMILEDD